MCERKSDLEEDLDKDCEGLQPVLLQHGEHFQGLIKREARAYTSTFQGDTNEEFSLYAQKIFSKNTQNLFPIVN